MAPREGMKAWSATALGFALTTVALLVSSPARAHAIGLSTGEYTARSSGVGVQLAFARGEVATMVPRLDENRDGHVTALEVEIAKSDLDAKVLSRIHVTSGGAACSPVLLSAALSDQDGVTVDGRFDCASAGLSFEVDVALLDDLANGHRHVARAVGATTHDEVLFKGHASFAIAPSAGEGREARPSVLAGKERRAAGAAALDTSSHVRAAWSFFKMGIEHILTGYDHLVFLFGLVLLRARRRELLAMVTAFTVAHSLTLVIAVLGVFSPTPRFVESAIALSIAYVGVENFFVKDASKRWRVTFPFGLIHGFGFAGALTALNLPRVQLPTALVSFNVGVEAGQVFSMAVVLPFMMIIRQKSWFEPRGVRVLSCAVALAGGTWFLIRVVQRG